MKPRSLPTMAIVLFGATHLSLAQENVRPPTEGPVAPVPPVIEPQRTPASDDTAIPQPPATPAEGTYADRPDLVSILEGADDFSTLVRLLRASGQDQVLKGAGGPFTIFAPNNSAFSKLPEGTLEGLLRPENREQLAALVGRHIVRGRLMLEGGEGENPGPVLPVSGGSMEIRTNAGVTTVASVVISRMDIAANNGVIHVVDAVLPSPTDTNNPVRPEPAPEVIIERETRVEVETVEEP